MFYIKIMQRFLDFNLLIIHEHLLTFKESDSQNGDATGKTNFTKVQLNFEFLKFGSLHKIHGT